MRFKNVLSMLFISIFLALSACAPADVDIPLDKEMTDASITAIENLSGEELEEGEYPVSFESGGLIPIEHRLLEGYFTVNALTKSGQDIYKVCLVEESYPVVNCQEKDFDSDEMAFTFFNVKENVSIWAYFTAIETENSSQFQNWRVIYTISKIESERFTKDLPH